MNVDSKKYMTTIFGNHYTCGENAFVLGEELKNEIADILSEFDESEIALFERYMNDGKTGLSEHETEVIARLLMRLRHPSRSRRVSKYFIPQVRDKRVLRIESLEAEQFGDIESYGKAFREDYEILIGYKGEKLMSLIGYIVQNPYVSFDGYSKMDYLKSDTTVKAYVNHNDETYLFSGNTERTEKGKELSGEYKSAIIYSSGYIPEEDPDYTVSDEEASCQVFSEKNEEGFRLKLRRYKKHSGDDTIEDFHNETKGLGTTDAFQYAINSFIRNYEPICVSKKKNIYAYLNKTGEFIPINPEHPDEKVFLSAGARKKFNYICFLQVNRFWDEVESMKDINHIRKPLFVKDFLGYFDPAEEKRGKYIDMALSLGRQVFFTDF